MKVVDETHHAELVDRHKLSEFVSRAHGVPASSVKLELKPLRGGLEAAAVARVNARWDDGSHKPRSVCFVAKRLEGVARREADLYRLLAGADVAFVPRLLGVDEVAPDATYLYLEWVRSNRAWPWREMAATGGVLGQLATLHTMANRDVTEAVGATWDYESELARRANVTLEVFEWAVRLPEVAHLCPYGRALRRIVSSLPALRRELLNVHPLGKTVLHGDVHSRNVVLRARGGAEQAILLDWARARVGSPLEDVSSWLESLGCWEPEVRRRHDTLLRQYLLARGLPGALERTLRDAYWLASVSNSLAGALEYHLGVAAGSGNRPARERTTAAGAARMHLRVIRAADSLWRA